MSKPCILKSIKYGDWYLWNDPQIRFSTFEVARQFLCNAREP